MAQGVRRGGRVEDMSVLKAISLWQPWASLWCSPAKVHETRHWPTRHRGWLLVHAAKHKLDDESADELDGIMDEHFGHHWGLEIPFGALIGMVNLVDCVCVETLPQEHRESDDYQCGNFSAGRYAWRRSEWKVFDRPIPYKGAQGFFNVPHSVLHANGRKI